MLADTSIKMVLGMLFLALNNAEIQLDAESLTWRSYSSAEALPIARRVQLINKREFAKAVLDENSETFVVYVAALEALEPAMAIHPSWAPLLAALQQDKGPIEILLEYTGYADVFSPDLAIKLPENTGINKHAIELMEGKQPPYGPIYSLGSVELETLKAYIETYLKTGFIWPSKLLQGPPSFFIRRSTATFACVSIIEA